MAGTYNFTIEQGTTFKCSIVWKTIENEIINLAAYTARMQIRYKTFDGELAIELSSANSKLQMLTDSMLITLSADETSALQLLPCKYDIELTKGTEVIRLLSGTIKISPEVTI